MPRISLRNRPLNLLLDIVFFTWLSYAVIAGRILPDEVVAVFRNDTPAIAASDPDPMFIPNPAVPIEGQNPVA